MTRMRSSATFTNALGKAEYTSMRVFVTAGAPRNRLSKAKDGAVTISVRAPSSGNQANQAVREVIAKEYGIPVAQVRILAGHRSRSKMIGIG